MSNFAIDGLISQFNTTDLIQAMIDIQIRGPIQQAEKKITAEAQKLASFQQLNANLLSLEISSQTLQSKSLFQSKNIYTSNESVVKATVSSSADVGSFSLRVDNLAKSDQVSSDVFTSASEELGFDGQFIVNGRTIDVNASDSLSAIATQISAAGTGIKASVVQIAPNQNKLVLNATQTGVDKIELREGGTSDILTQLGLLDTDTTNVSYDYTVNANTIGAVSKTITDLDDPTGTYPFTYSNQSFSVTDAGGQDTITVTLDGILSLQEIADEINAVSASQKNLINAEVTDGRLVISSDTGIPTRFEDGDNVLHGLGIISGTQSEAFSSSSRSIAQLLDIDTSGVSTIQLGDGDGSDFISVDIDFSSDSLDDIAESINFEAGFAGSDITANVISVNGFSRLELVSASGNVQFTSDPDQVFQTLGLVDRAFKHHDQQGENSQFNYNGINVNRNENLVTDLVEGVSLALISEGADIATVSVSQNLSHVQSAISSFVDAYNSAMSFISEQTFFDSSSGAKAALFGNSTIRELESQMANAVSRAIPNFPGVEVSDLNDGEGIDLGKIKITDRDGVSSEIDLSGVLTVQDVIDQINGAEDIQVSAVLNADGRSFNIVDESGGYSRLIVEEIDGGMTAEDLGIRGSISGNKITGSYIYEGGAMPISLAGVSLTATGALTFDTSKFQTALNEDPDQLENMLSATGVGFAANFRATMRQFTAYGTGRLDSSTNAIQERIELYQEQIDRYNSRSESMERTLRKRFVALEIAMAESQNVSQFLTERLSASGNNN